MTAVHRVYNIVKDRGRSKQTPAPEAKVLLLIRLVVYFEFEVSSRMCRLRRESLFSLIYPRDKYKKEIVDLFSKTLPPILMHNVSCRDVGLNK